MSDVICPHGLQERTCPICRDAAQRPWSPLDLVVCDPRCTDNKCVRPGVGPCNRVGAR